MGPDYGCWNCDLGFDKLIDEEHRRIVGSFRYWSEFLPDRFFKSSRFQRLLIYLCHHSMDDEKEYTEVEHSNLDAKINT